MLTNTLSKIQFKHHKNLSKGLLLVGLNGLLFGLIFFMAFTEDTKTVIKETGHLFWKETTETIINVELGERIPYLIVAIIMILVAIICLISALKLSQMPGKFKKYDAILKGNEKLRIQLIADMTNRNQHLVIIDLQNMIDSGYISDYYIDHKNGLIINKSFTPTNIVKKVLKCQKCGSDNEITVGLTNYCMYCDSIISE